MSVEGGEKEKREQKKCYGFFTPMPRDGHFAMCLKNSY